MFEYVKVMWEELGPVGIGSILGFVLYNLLLIYAIYRLEKKVKILMKDKEQRDESMKPVQSYCDRGIGNDESPSHQVRTEISEG